MSNLLNRGDLYFIRDAMHEIADEIEAAEEITDIYTLEDAVEQLKEAIEMLEAFTVEATAKGVFKI